MISKQFPAIKSLVLGFLLLAINSQALAEPGLPIVNMVENDAGGTQYSLTLQLIALMTVLTLLPSLLLMMTSFVRIIIVLSLLRQALGTAQTPPNQVLLGLALFLTIFIMSPVLSSIYDDAITPYLKKKSASRRLGRGANSGEKFHAEPDARNNIAMFAEITSNDNIEEPADVPFATLVPHLLRLS